VGTDPTLHVVAERVARRRDELKGEKHLEVCDGYVGYEIEQKLPERVSRANTWQECKKKDEGAQRCLIVAGARMGRLTWGMKPKADRYGRVEKSPKEKAAEKDERATEKKRQEALRKVWDGIMSAVDDWLTSADLLPNNIIRFGVKIFFGRLWDEHRKRLCQLHGWERPPLEEGQNPWERPKWEDVGTEQIENMGPAQLLRFFAECSLIHGLDPDPAAADGLREIGRGMGVNVDAIEAAAKEQTA